MSPARTFSGGINLFVGRCRAFGPSPEEDASVRCGAGFRGRWCRFTDSLEQAPRLGGTGYGNMWSRLNFIVGAGAAGAHRMQKRVAGSGNILEPAPEGSGTGTVHSGSLLR